MEQDPKAEEPTPPKTEDVIDGGGDDQDTPAADADVTDAEGESDDDGAEQEAPQKKSYPD